MFVPLLEARHGDLLVSTDRAKLDLDAVVAMLRASHWGQAVTRPVIQKAIENSLCVGAFDAAGRTVGLLRAVTDRATYAYLTDVIVADDARGRGIGTHMMDLLLAHPDMHGLRRIALYTRDAKRLYEKYGFVEGTAAASIYMERKA